jgi:ABC-type glycerol-3-phosphate transport system permease component
MNVPGKIFILMGLILLIVDGYLSIKHTHVINSAWGFIIVSAIGLFGIIYMGHGCLKYMRGE